MTARRVLGQPIVRLYCSRCPASLEVGTEGGAITLDDARSAANGDRGWTFDGSEDLCPDCTVKHLRSRR